VLLRDGVRGREQARFLTSELQVCDSDRPKSTARRGGIAVFAAHPSDASGHAGTEFAHGGSADFSQELVVVREVTIGGIRHHTHHPCRFTEHHGIRATAPGQLKPGGDQAVADGAARAALPGPGYLSC
jgi:hypothetical protein